MDAIIKLDLSRSVNENGSSAEGGTRLLGSGPLSSILATGKGRLIIF